ncbi:hypothetical protein CKA32_004968 [Geitlerinema sp. FC II]|nr:hypothetical protein CKA32_004968 [Geitlerinema sp. FC II]
MRSKFRFYVIVRMSFCDLDRIFRERGIGNRESGTGNSSEDGRSVFPSSPCPSSLFTDEAPLLC